MPKTKEKNEELVEEPELCEKCGSKLVEEDGVKFCPNCEGSIDFFGDDDE